MEQRLPAVPCLAVVPSLITWRNRQSTELVTLDEPHSAAAESYRTLRTALQFLALDSAMQVVQVTSPDPGDGKSTTASNLAVSMAQADRRVILVDCDLRRPRIAEFFGMPQSPGITNALLGEVPWQATARRVKGVPNLVVMPSRTAAAGAVGTAGRGRAPPSCSPSSGSTPTSSSSTRRPSCRCPTPW